MLALPCKFSLHSLQSSFCISSNSLFKHFSFHLNNWDKKLTISYHSSVVFRNLVFLFNLWTSYLHNLVSQTYSLNARVLIAGFFSLFLSPKRLRIKIFILSRIKLYFYINIISILPQMQVLDTFNYIINYYFDNSIVLDNSVYFEILFMLVIVILI